MNFTKRTLFILTLFSVVLLAISGVVMARESETPAAAAATASVATRQTVAPMAQQEALATALDYIQQNKTTLGLTDADLDDFVVQWQSTSPQSGFTRIILGQRHAGIEVWHGDLRINILRDGTVLNLHNQFVPGLASKVNGTTPALSATAAVEAAASHLGLTITEPLVVEESLFGAEQAAVLSNGGISQAAIPVKLMYQPGDKGEVRLAWDMEIEELNTINWWTMRVDAETGKVLSQLNRVADDSYRVYPPPVESPYFSVPPAPADGRILVANPATANGSPFGWHDTNGVAGAEFTTTQGNNAHGYTDTNADNVPDAGSSPDGGATLVFDFPINLAGEPSTYRPAAVTNLFYWNNIIHDVFYEYGFTEANANFQENNYGNGGTGSDYVFAEAQDGSGTCNANMGTPGDGGNPRMQMYICEMAGGPPAQDGDLDNLVIVHEYGHGISNRLNDPVSASCLGNAEQMGEGWSDYWGAWMTIEPGDAGTDARTVGTYLFEQGPGGPGIRPAPYSTDFGVNDYTYGDLPPLAIPHGVGFLWATMIWDMNWALIDEHGFNPDIYDDWSTGGNNLANQLVIDGLLLQPCGPGFVDGRDAILAADIALTSGENQCTIWAAFARRGLGFSASQGSPNSRTDGTEAFDMPPACLTIDVIPASQSICQGDAAEYLVSVGTDFTSPPVTLSATGNPPPSTVTFSPNPVQQVPDNSEMTVGNTASVAAGNYTITIEADDGIISHTVDADLEVVAGAPGAPTLVSPGDGESDVVTSPTLTWNAVATAADYLVEIATDVAFTNIVYSATETTTSHVVDADLEYGTTYYWRVTAQNVCGGGTASVIFSFTTEFLPGACLPGTTPSVHYETDLEDGAPGWTHSGTQDTWVLTDTHTTSGVNAWYALDPETLSDQRLVSPAVVLPGVSESPITLKFENRQAFETPNTDGRCWDAGILEISTNGGGSWSVVPQGSMLSDPYDNIIWNDQPGNNPITNDYGAILAWCEPVPSWVTSVVDLDAYAGNTVQFRWRLGSDSAAGNEGWYLDDVSVQSCVPSDYGVSLSPDMAASGDAGESVTYQVMITNTGDLTDTFDLTVTGQIWATILSTDTIALTPGASTTFTATVDIPAGELGGASDTATVTATSQGDGAQTDSTNLTTSVTLVRDVELATADATLSGAPGAMVTYTLHLTNTGNAADDFTLSMTGNDWMTHVEPMTATVDAGEMITVTVVVHIDADATHGEEDTVTITAVSDNDASATDSVELTTTAEVEGFDYLIYLPVIMKP